MYLFNFLVLAFFMGLLYKKFQPDNRLLFGCQRLVRVICALALGIIYKQYYEVGDTWNFFDDAVQLSQLAKEDFFSISFFVE